MTEWFVLYFGSVVKKKYLLLSAFLGQRVGMLLIFCY
nr:MAG TPA: hypothetical protein [Caudoviricetes sp.]